MALSRKSPYVETAHKVSGLMLANHTCMSQVSSRASTVVRLTRHCQRVSLYSALKASRLLCMFMVPWQCQMPIATKTLFGMTAIRVQHCIVLPRHAGRKCRSPCSDAAATYALNSNRADFLVLVKWLWRIFGSCYRRDVVERRV